MYNKMKKYKCKNCGHDWYSNIGRLPKACPNCKRYDWNKKK